MALRDEVGFVTPIRPLERGGEPWVVSGRPGFYEVMVHPDDAFVHLTHGFPHRGRRLKCEAVGVWPLVNAIQLCVYDAEHATGVRSLPLRAAA